MKWEDHIAVTADVAAGKPVIAGTRVPVQIVLGSLGGGMTMEQVCVDYNLTQDDVRAALIYAAEVLAAEGSHALPGR